jgi:hypothetical protein
MANDPLGHGHRGRLHTAQSRTGGFRVRVPRILPHLSERQVKVFLACAVICCAYVVGLLVETTESMEEVLYGPVADAIAAVAGLVVLWCWLWKNPHHPNDHHSHRH